MPPLWKARLIMAFVVATGSQVAVNALSFLAGALEGLQSGGLAATMFAPFVLAALLLPLAAAPLARRWTQGAASTGRPAATLFVVLVLAEVGTAGARVLAALPPWDGAGALHGLMLSYAAAAAVLSRRD